MDFNWNSLLVTPLHYGEMIFAFLATLSFLLFLRGFLGSIGNVFRMSGHEEHVEHAQVRVVHGALLLLFVFALWEMVRTIFIWIGLLDGDPSLGLYIFGISIIVWAFLGIKKSLFAGGGGGGH